MLDQRLGEVRKEFTYALRKIGNADAISHLERAATDPQMATYALFALTRLVQEEKLLALCDEALKLPKVARREELEKMRANLQKAIAGNSEQAKADEWLRRNGIPHTISDLYRDPACCPECVPQLLELFKSFPSLKVRVLAVNALFHRKPDRAQTAEAVESLMTLIKERAGEYGHWLSMLVMNTLAGRIDKGRADEIGKMALDPRYGDLRGDFTYVLFKMGNAEAISYLRRAAKQPATAALALELLARLKAPDALDLCEKALADPKVPYKDAIKETYSKLKRRLAKKPPGPSHATTEAFPKGMAEWSANLDGADLPKVLRAIHKSVEGFGKAEIAEVRSAADGLSAEEEESSGDHTARWNFPAKFEGKEIALWMELFCDDPDAFDLAVFGPAEPISKIGSALKQVLGD